MGFNMNNENNKNKNQINAYDFVGFPDRQLRDEAGQIFDVEKLRLISIKDESLITFDPYLEPVSYTHLDVYKRQAIMDKLERGVTLLEATGAYTGKSQKVIMCAVTKSEAFKIRRLVNNIDPDAFIIIGEAGEILGEGFKALE